MRELFSGKPICEECERLKMRNLELQQKLAAMCGLDSEVAALRQRVADLEAELERDLDADSPWSAGEWSEADTMPEVPSGITRIDEGDTPCDLLPAGWEELR